MPHPFSLIFVLPISFPLISRLLCGSISVARVCWVLHPSVKDGVFWPKVSDETGTEAAFCFLLSFTYMSPLIHDILSPFYTCSTSLPSHTCPMSPVMYVSSHTCPVSLISSHTHRHTQTRTRAHAHTVLDIYNLETLVVRPIRIFILSWCHLPQKKAHIILQMAPLFRFGGITDIYLYTWNSELDPTGDGSVYEHTALKSRPQGFTVGCQSKYWSRPTQTFCILISILIKQNINSLRHKIYNVLPQAIFFSTRVSQWWCYFFLLTSVHCMNSFAFGRWQIAPRNGDPEEEVGTWDESLALG